MGATRCSRAVPGCPRRPVRPAPTPLTRSRNARRAAAGLLAAVSLPGGLGAARAGPLRDPVDSTCISSPFGWRHRVGPMAPAGFHNGIDIPAPAGGLVHAAAAGRISRIERKGIGGLQVFVTHPGGLTTLYAHLGSVTAAIEEGATAVAAGEPIGRIGRTGVTYGTHLFFAVFAAGRAIDPALLLGLPLCGGGRRVDIGPATAP